MSTPKKVKAKNITQYKILENNLRYYRNVLRLTQAETAERADISAKYLSLMECQISSNSPSLEVLFDLANALNIEPYQLFKRLIEI